MVDFRYKNVEPRAQMCNYCGSGPWNPREHTSKDQRSGDIIQEAHWVCGRCGSRFDSGVIKVIKENENKQ